MEEFYPFMSGIWKTKINYKNKEKLIKNIEEYCKKNNNLTPKGWKCLVKSSFSKKENKIPKDLVDIIEKKLNDFLNLIQKNIKLDGNYFINDIWFNYYINDYFQEPHIHKDSLFSGCYYLKFNSNHHHQTTFYNPNHHFNYLNFEDNSYFCFNPQCQEDDLIIFPSLLEHGTKGMRENSNDSRITISFNVCNSSINTYKHCKKEYQYR